MNSNPAKDNYCDQKSFRSEYSKPRMLNFSSRNDGFATLTQYPKMAVSVNVIKQLSLCW